MKTFYHLLFILATICSCKKGNMEWENLIINNSLDGWHIYQDDGTKKGWKVDNEILIFDSVSKVIRNLYNFSPKIPQIPKATYIFFSTMTPEKRQLSTSPRNCSVFGKSKKRNLYS